MSTRVRHTRFTLPWRGRVACRSEARASGVGRQRTVDNKRAYSRRAAGLGSRLVRAPCLRVPFRRSVLRAGLLPPPAPQLPARDPRALGERLQLRPLDGRMDALVERLLRE